MSVGCQRPMCILPWQAMAQPVSRPCRRVRSTGCTGSSRMRGDPVGTAATPPPSSNFKLSSPLQLISCLANFLFRPEADFKSLTRCSHRNRTETVGAPRVGTVRFVDAAITKRDPERHPPESQSNGVSSWAGACDWYRPRECRVRASGNPASAPPARREAADIANLVLFLASDESRFITGAQYRIDGGMGAT